MADISQITLLNGDVVNLKDSAGREAVTTGLAGKVDIAQGVQNAGKILKVSSAGRLELVASSSGTGDVVGPASSTDEHVAVFDGAGGKTIKDSGFTIGKSVPSNAVFTDTTYESKTAASGGTDVSLVTTGEKYTWNNKTSNIGTVTGVKMNNGSSITPDSNGVVDLGTVITSHQDISGKADLDENGKVPSSQLPSYVDDVLEYASSSSFPLTGESGKIYVALDENKTYRWSGSNYVEISASLALGETSATAYRGDRGAAAYAAAITNVDSTPTTNSTHLITSGGVKAALPSDMTAASASANGVHGLVPAPGSGKQTSFLRGDATWAVPTNTTYADFTAATSAAAGTHGLVPAPGSGKQSCFLRGDKTWAALGGAASKSVANNVTTSSSGSSVLDAYQGKVLNDKILSLMMVKDKTIPAIDLPANGTSNGSVYVAETGYNILGIVGYIGGAYSSKTTIQEMYVDGNTAYLYLRNNTSSAITVGAGKIKILYSKNS